MGVRGLMSYVENNRNAFYTQERLCDSNLVIDGFGLIYALYFDDGRDGTLNGEFLDLYQNIESFFLSLAECNISPLVIFDGPIESAKLPCVVGRLNERVQDVHKILTGRSTSGRLLPLFAVDALHHYLLSNGIPMAVTLVDADDETVAVANHLNCPVLSQDSDYYIYNVIGGYLPFSHFQWKQVRVDRKTRRNVIFCEKYHISIMRDRFGIHIHILPFLSVLLGNDWIDPSVFRELVSSFPLARPNSQHRGKKSSSYDQRMISVLNWLATKRANDNAVFNTLFSHLRRTQQGSLMRKVEECIAMYREPTEIAETLKTLGILKWRRGTFQPNSHQVIQDIVRRCRAHPFVMNLLESCYVCLPVIMSDSQKPSPHDVATDIRYLTYRVLLRQYRLPMAGPELLYLQEYDKLRLTYAKSSPKSVLTSQCVKCEQRHSVDQTCALNGAMKFSHNSAMYLMQKLLPKISSFCEFAERCSAFKVPQNLKVYMDLVMSSTLLWINKTTPDPIKKCAILVILSWSLCATCNIQPDKTRRRRRQSGQGRYQSQDDSYELKVEQFLHHLNPRAVMSASGQNIVMEHDLDIKFLHSVSQWLCIINATIILHQVVENPPTKFSIHYFLTSSSLLHEIHFQLRLLLKNSTRGDFISLSRRIAERLVSMPNIKNVFEVFTAFLTS